MRVGGAGEALRIVEAAPEQAGPDPHRVQRRAQLVREGGQELVLGLARRFRLLPHGLLPREQIVALPLRRALGGDVLAGADVAGEGAVGIVQGDAVVAHPAVGLVVPPQAVLDPEAAARREGLRDGLGAAVAVLRVHVPQPAHARLVLEALTHEREPARVEPRAARVGRGQPHQHRRRVGHRAEARLSRPRGLLGGPAPDRVEGDDAHRSVGRGAGSLREHQRAARVHPAVGAGGAPVAGLAGPLRILLGQRVHQVQVAGPLVGMENLSERVAHDLLRRAAHQLAVATVDQHEPAVRIDLGDARGGLVHQGGEPGQPVALRALRALEGLRGGRQVVRDQREIGDLRADPVGPPALPQLRGRPGQRPERAQDRPRHQRGQAHRDQQRRRARARERGERAPPRRVERRHRRGQHHVPVGEPRAGVGEVDRPLRHVRPPAPARRGRAGHERKARAPGQAGGGGQAGEHIAAGVHQRGRPVGRQPVPDEAGGHRVGGDGGAQHEARDPVADHRHSHHERVRSRVRIVRHHRSAPIEHLADALGVRRRDGGRGPLGPGHRPALRSLQRHRAPAALARHQAHEVVPQRVRIRPLERRRGGDRLQGVDAVVQIAVDRGGESLRGLLHPAAGGRALIPHHGRRQPDREQRHRQHRRPRQPDEVRAEGEAAAAQRARHAAGSVGRASCPASVAELRYARKWG